MQPDSFQDLLNQGKAYIGLIPKDSHLAAKYKEAKVTFTTLQYTKMVARRLDLLFSYPILIFGLIGLWTLRKKRTARGTLVLLLLGVGLAYCVLFYRSVYIHVWHTYYLAAPIAILAALGARTALSGTHEKVRNGLASSLNWSRSAVFLLVALAIVGGLPRLHSLHQIQIKILPGDQFEQSMFIKKVGTHIESVTPVHDIVLTNLHNIGGAFSYYAERKVVYGMDSLPTLQDFLRKTPRKAGVHLLMWQEPDMHIEADALYHWLEEKAKSEEFVIQGYRFFWFTLSPEALVEVGG